MTVKHTTTTIKCTIFSKCAVHNSKDGSPKDNGTCNYGYVQKTMQNLNLESSGDKNYNK